MKRFWLARVLKFAVVVVIAAAVLSFIVMHLWNFVVPDVFGGHTIGFVQALALLVLARLLVGRIGPGGFGPGRHWRGRMAERWQQMTPEEREQVRARFRGRCGFGGSQAGEEKA